MRSVKAVVTVAVATAVTALGIALIVWTAPVAAATLTAASCSYSDVNAKVGAAANGDTVVVPAGSCAWASGLAISKAITFRGAGIGQTFITYALTAGAMIVITEQTTGNVRVQGFEFIAGATQGSNPNVYIQVNYATGGKPVVISDSKWNLGSGTSAIGMATNRGLITRNSFYGTVGGSGCLNNSGAVRHYAVSLTSSWTSPPTYGMADVNGDQNVYFENNAAYDVLEGIDVSDQGRFVFRYNTWSNSGFLHHGGDTSPYGARYSEVYNNTFVWDTSVKCPPDLPTNVNALIFLRGGTSLIHDNVIPNVISQAWNDKSEVSFTDEKLRRNAGYLACWSQGYPSPYQVGWGYSTGGTQAGTSGVFQDIEPVYLWNNTGGGNYNNPVIADPYNDCGTMFSADVIKVNREYYPNTAKPGYTPYTYPHPLTGSQPAPLGPTNLTVN